MARPPEDKEMAAVMAALMRFRDPDNPTVSTVPEPT
jgi:hypothetical protein